MERITGFLMKYLNELGYLALEMAPWLMLGMIFAGLLKIWFPEATISRHLGKSDFKSVMKAALLGVPLPLCSCGVIPTAVAFYRSGASKGATNSFLISTPQTGVDSILATYSLLGLPFALIRPVVAFVTGIGGGLLTNLFDKNRNQEELIVPDDASCETGSCAVSNSENAVNDSKLKTKWRIFWQYAFVELLQDIAKWLIIGFLAAALISVLIPDNFFEAFKGYGIIEILVVLAVAAPLYICATGSIPIAAVLLAKGISPGAALVFLMAGPATNIATMAVIGKIMGRKSLILYLSSIIGGAIIFGLAINQFIPAEWLLKDAHLMHAGHNHEEMLPFWFKLLALSALILAMVGGYIYSRINKVKTINKMEGIAVKVTGMSCTHCEATVTRNLESLSGIEKVVADHRTESVKITGEAIDLEKVEQVVNGLGYKYIGKIFLAP